jgi:2-polyprenyl-3-methyl-5-hydroxy-6-metoxy-1,4-benzoquinol methylase
MRCYLCNSSQLRYERIVGGIKLLRCNKCSLLMTAVNPTINDRRKFNLKYYNKAYIKNYLINKERITDVFLKRTREIEAILPGGKLLDIGCGAGFFIQTLFLKGKNKWETYGIDINKSLISHAMRSKAGKFFCAPINTRLFPDNYFDCITLFDVIEHDVKLNNNLKNINRMLRVNGLLVIQVPNYKSIMAKLTKTNWDWWSIPDHVVHFSPLTIRRALENNGFMILRKITWEPRRDFVMNISGTIRGSLPNILFINKIISKLLIIPLTIFKK